MKKVLLVPSDITQTVKPVDETLSNLDSEMMRIISAQDMPLDVKIRKYNQVLQRYKFLQMERNRPYQIEDLQQKNETIQYETILKGLPETKVPLAKLLTDFIMQQSNIQIENNGEISVNGSRIRNSNIVDIIHDLVRDRKTHLPPTGVDRILGVLKQANMPLEYIGNKNRLPLYMQTNPPTVLRRANQWEE